MTPDEAPVDPTCEQRVQAVLALFRGEPVTQVSTQYRVCRRDLYKFRRRALAAIRQALTDHRRGPRRSHNIQAGVMVSRAWPLETIVMAVLLYKAQVFLSDGRNAKQRRDSR
jgi:hypothetical protein